MTTMVPKRFSVCALVAAVALLVGGCSSDHLTQKTAIAVQRCPPAIGAASGSGRTTPTRPTSQLRFEGGLVEPITLIQATDRLEPPLPSDKPMISATTALHPKGILDYVLGRCPDTYVRLARHDSGKGPKPLVWAVIMNDTQNGRAGSQRQLGYVVVVVDANTGYVTEEVAYEPPLADSQLR